MALSRMFMLCEGLSLILASASPRRQKFFSGLGIPFDAIPVGDEPDPGKDETAPEYAARAAGAKLGQCREKLGDAANRVILAADTCVSLHGRLLGKPSRPADAYAMLAALNGKSCDVASAACMSLPNGKSIQIVDVATVNFAFWPNEILKTYINTGEPLDKAGAFAIQGLGSFLIKSVSGSFATVMGLPATGIVKTMLEQKIICPRDGARADQV